LWRVSEQGRTLAAAAEPALDTARIFAAVLILSALVLVLYALVSPRRAAPRPLAAHACVGDEWLSRISPRCWRSRPPRPGSEKVSLTPDWTPNPDHVGIYDAQQTGLFAEAGLDVSVRVPSDPTSVLKLVGVGESRETKWY
jgi:ABC-type nitrate/sulfonate/bicarbonate transport system substrate-binding protein